TGSRAEGPRSRQSWPVGTLRRRSMLDLTLRFMRWLAEVRVQAQWPCPEVRNHQRAAEHRHVLHEHAHLHLGQAGVRDRPEVVHHQRDWNKKQREQTRTDPGV